MGILGEALALAVGKGSVACAIKGLGFRVSENGGGGFTLFWNPYNKDPIIRVPYFRKLLYGFVKLRVRFRGTGVYTTGLKPTSPQDLLHIALTPIPPDR